MGLTRMWDRDRKKNKKQKEAWEKKFNYSSFGEEGETQIDT